MILFLPMFYFPISGRRRGMSHAVTPLLSKLEKEVKLQSKKGPFKDLELHFV